MFVSGTKEIISVDATSGIEPNYRPLMHLFPVRVLIGVIGNFVVGSSVIIQPCCICPSLVALTLNEVVVVSGVSLNTPITVGARNLPVHL